MHVDDAGLSSLIIPLSQVWEDLKKHEIEVFDFPRDAEDDESVAVDLESLVYPIFAVCSSDATITADGRSFRGRSYPWGFVDGGMNAT